MKYFRRLVAIFFSLIVIVSLVPVQPAQAASPKTFIKKYSKSVKEVSDKHNLYGSVMMAQAGLESSWGKSALSKKAHNFFGIKGSYKGKSVRMKTFEYTASGSRYTTYAKFRKYPNAKASFEDYAKVLRKGTSWNSKFYKKTWKENASKYTVATKALSHTYSTSAAYGSTLNRIIRTHGLTKTLDQEIKYSHKKATPKVDTTMTSAKVKSNDLFSTLLARIGKHTVGLSSKVPQIETRI